MLRYGLFCWDLGTRLRTGFQANVFAVCLKPKLQTDTKLACDLIFNIAIAKSN